MYCPVCMDETELTSKGINGLPRNFYVEHLLELQDMPDQVSNKCDLCADNEMASSFCQACRLNLCEFCAHVHKRQRKTSNHTLTPAENLPQSVLLQSMLNGISNPKQGQPPRCEAHTSHRLSLFCDSCSVPVCQMCTMREHCEHTFIPLDSVTKQQEEILRNVLTRTKPFLVSLNDSMKNIEYVTTNVQERAKVVAAEICDSIDERMRALQEHKRALLTQLDALKTQKVNTLNQQLEELTTSFDSVVSLSNLASTAIKESNATAMFSSNAPIVAKLETLVSEKQDLTLKEDDYIQYNPTAAAGEIKGVEMFGTLDSRGPSAAHSVAEGEGLFEAHQGRVSTFKVTVNDRYKQRRKDGKDIVETKIENHTGAGANASITNLGSGTFEFSYVPETRGEHKISVLIQGKHVRSSPFIINVSPRRNEHSGVFHCCSFCSSKGRKHVRCGCGSRMPGGYSGCGHGHPGHPGCQHWSCCGRTEQKSECFS